MLNINYITRPFFNDIALELIQELKQKSALNVIIIISAYNIPYLSINDDPDADLSDPVKTAKRIADKLYSRYFDYFEGANVICKYEEQKETSFKNTLNWIKFLSANKDILNADLNILESLSLADWYFLLKIRNKKIYHILHDPVTHTGEARKRLDIIRKIYFKYVDKFILYSSFATDLFDANFPAYAGKTITLKTPIYYNQKVDIQKQSDDDNRQVLFFGRISPYKGVELFYSAAARLSEEFKDVTFIVAGKSDSNYAPEFLNNSQYKNIRILNQYIELNTLAELMTQASFCVLPYLDATQSGVIMTCYAYDLPVLVSDCQGLIEYCLDKESFSFKNRELEDLINKMRNLLLNEDLLLEYKKSITSYSNMNVSAINADKILGA